MSCSTSHPPSWLTPRGLPSSCRSGISRRAPASNACWSYSRLTEVVEQTSETASATGEEPMPFPPKRFPCDVPRGTYRLIGWLGQGPESLVYKAEKTSEMGRAVAIKFCTAQARDGSPLSGEDLRLRLRWFRDEADRSLGHHSPYLTPAHEVLDF